MQKWMCYNLLFKNKLPLPTSAFDNITTKLQADGKI